MKDILRKIAGLIVEIPEEPAPTPEPGDRPLPPAGGPQKKTIADIVRSAPGPNLDEVHVPVKLPPSPAGAPVPPLPPGEGAGTGTWPASGDAATGSGAPGAALPPVVPTPREDGTLFLDFAEIYRRAALPPTPFTAEQTLDMIAGLPSEMPLDARRQMVTVMLSTMGRTVGVTQETIVADAALKVAALNSYAEGMTHQATDFISRAEAEITRLEAQIQQYRDQIGGLKGKLGDLQRLCSTEVHRLDDVAEFFSLDTGDSRHAPARDAGSGGTPPATS